MSYPAEVYLQVASTDTLFVISDVSLEERPFVGYRFYHHGDLFVVLTGYRRTNGTFILYVETSGGLTPMRHTLPLGWMNGCDFWTVYEIDESTATFLPRRFDLEQSMVLSWVKAGF